MRKKLIIGKWKMNGDLQQNQRLIEGIQSSYSSAVQNNWLTVVVCPPVIYLWQLQKLLLDQAIKLGAQNVSEQVSGAYTGETSVDMLVDYGCEYVLLGHSERRTLFAEDNVLIARKVKAVLAKGMTPVLCVGETLDDYNNGVTEEVVAKQINDVVDIVGVDHFANIVIAYEPVWAIGTGEVATPEYAQNVHQFIRDLIARRNQQVADQLLLLYGGSVNQNNAESLFVQNDIDGALIGGASLSASQFATICAIQNRQVLTLAV